MLFELINNKHMQVFHSHNSFLCCRVYLARFCLPVAGEVLNPVFIPVAVCLYEQPQALHHN